MMAMGAAQFSLPQNVFDKDFVAAMYGRVSGARIPMRTLLNRAR